MWWKVLIATCLLLGSAYMGGKVLYEDYIVDKALEQQMKVIIKEMQANNTQEYCTHPMGDKICHYVCTKKGAGYGQCGPKEIQKTDTNEYETVYTCSCKPYNRLY